MRHPRRHFLAPSFLLAALLVTGCHLASGDSGGGGNSGNSGTGGAAAPGTCSNTDKNTLPIDATGWVALTCNNFDIQGAFYCYTDGVTQTDCTTGKTPWKASSSGMCLSGTTLGTSAAYGAAIGLSLNDPGGGMKKGTYDATANNVIGFEITLTGSWSGLDLRIGFKNADDVSPFYTVIGPGQYQVKFTQAMVPANWNVTNAGKTADPTALSDLQFQIAGDTKAAPFNFCITEVKPITSGASTGTGGSSGSGCCTLSPVGGGASKCGTLDRIDNAGNYSIQNDVYNAMGGSECITATAGGNCVGFTATPMLNVTGNTPGSYPSVIYGWHYGAFYGSYSAAKAISSIGSIPSSWQYTVPGSGVKYDVAYDIWANQSGGNPSQPDANTLELMIWLDYTSDAVPAGAATGQTTTIAGQTWQIYTGMVSTWHYIAYRRAAGGPPFSNVDLKPFLTDAMTRNVGITSSWYLLSVEAGFEIWKGQNVPFVTNAYSVTAN